MEKKNLMGGGTYESPELNVIDLSVEGVLCASGIIDGAGEDTI